MPTLTLALPVAGSKILAGPLATNFAAIQALVNGGLDGSNINQAVPIQIGAGGLLIGADVNLYRSGASLLKTDDAFLAAANIVAGHTGAQQAEIGAAGPGGQAGIRFGAASDAAIYRTAAATLRTDGILQVNGNLNFVNDGIGLNFGVSQDVNLYRGAANLLLTDDTFQAAAFLSKGPYRTDLAVETSVAFGALKLADLDYRFAIQGTGVILWGTGSGAQDTNLYRSGAGILKTDGKLAIASMTIDPTIPAVTGGGNLDWRGSADVYVSAGGATGTVSLRNLTSGVTGLVVMETGQVRVPISGATGGILIGGDVNLYRSAANVLKTDDELQVAGNIETALSLILRSATSGIYFGTGTDVFLSRTGADQLEMGAGDTLKVSSAGLKFNDNTVQTTAAVPTPAPTPATTLPGSPTNGQRAILTDSLTVPTYMWEFQYDTSITDAYKWRFVGGAPLQSFAATQKSTSGYTSMVALTAPRAGIYRVQATAGGRTQGGTPVAVFRAVVNGSVEYTQSDTASFTNHFHYAAQDRTIAASGTLDLQYQSNGTDNTVVNGQAVLVPLRVS